MKLFPVTFLCSVLLAVVVAQQHNAGVRSNNEIETTPKIIAGDLYRGQREFTLAMLEAIRKVKPNENVFFSSYSTFHALLLIYLGAKGNTESELVQALSLQWANNKTQLNKAYRMERQLRYRRLANTSVEFSSAGKIYFDRDVHMSTGLANHFQDAVETLDFRHDAEASRRSINQWIAERTRNEIPEMLDVGDITAASQMVLATAAYFKGQWSDKFDVKDTKLEIFYSATSHQSVVAMMHKQGTFNFAIDEQIGAHILQMPYTTSSDDRRDSNISMVIVLPPFQSSLDEVLSRLKSYSLENALRASLPQEIEISLPKFKFEQTLELAPILRELGINSLFDQDADLSGFSAETQLKLDDVKHVAKIKVDEEGSTAAAATVFFSYRFARPVEPTRFECNHPFLFLIYDRSANAILFTCIYWGPDIQK